MGPEYHNSSTHEESPSRLQDSQRRFIPAELYPEDFHDLDSTDYDGAGWAGGDEDFTFVPCPAMDPCEHCGRLLRHNDSIIVAIDGACRGNGTSSAESAVGVYFSKFSRWNITERTDDAAPTSQKAELIACLAALKLAHMISDDHVVCNSTLGQCVIKADSEYVVKGMTEWITKWKNNGYKNARGTSVINAILFQKLEREVVNLNDKGVKVLFWHVPRSRNMEADGLANDGFENVDTCMSAFKGESFFM